VAEAVIRIVSKWRNAAAIFEPWSVVVAMSSLKLIFQLSNVSVMVQTIFSPVWSSKYSEKMILKSTLNCCYSYVWLAGRICPKVCCGRKVRSIVETSCHDLFFEMRMQLWDFTSEMTL